MADYLELLGGALGQRFRSDDDIVDRLSHRYTTLILVVLCAVVGTQQHVGQPIQCWTPAHFTDSWNKYTENYCWISNTYYIPINSLNPNLPVPSVLKKDKGEVPYYQWVPLFLLVQAILFRIPTAIWRSLNDKQGVDIDGMVKICSDVEQLDPSTRAKTIAFLVRHFDRYLSTMREYRRGKLARTKQLIVKKSGLLCGKRFGTWLVFLYIIVKILYLVNAIGQIYLLNGFIGSGYSAYGFQVIRQLANGSTFDGFEKFPRVTLCDLEMRVLANVHRHTIQCTLPINLFNEKIYIFIWFWLVFICIATICGMLVWLIFFIGQNPRRFVSKYLRCMSRIKKNEQREMVDAFVYQYLRRDGAFLLKLIGRNTNDIIITELVCELWDFFLKHRKEHHPLDVDPGLHNDVTSHHKLVESSSH